MKLDWPVALFLIRQAGVSFSRVSRTVHSRTVQLCLLCVTLVIAQQAVAQNISGDMSKQWVSAINNDQVSVLKQILDEQGDDQAAQKDLLASLNSNDKSALMVACKEGDLALVKRLVALGSDVNQATLTGGTPLMYAVLGNHLPVAQWLQASGADINAKGTNGWSAATIAGAKGQTEILRWLIELGADVNSPDVYRFTPLMRAVDNQHLESVQVLLSLGRAGVDFKDESDNTALHLAVANRHRALVRLLLSHGADPTQANRDGITPLDLANQFPALSGIFSK